ncbi:MAG: glycosyltransferase [Desulfobacteraceae bacterium]|nr:glycosyltransferase [Desulfobacteraceae bacterium]
MTIKTLHLIPFIEKEKGGAVYALMNILEMERNIGGIKSTVISFKNKNGKNSFPQNTLFKLFSASFPKRFSRSRDFKKWLKHNAAKYDVVIFHTIWNIYQIEAAGILNKLKVPFIVWPHGSLDPFDLNKRKLFKRIAGPIVIRPMLANCRTVCCTSEYEANELEKYDAKASVTILPLPVVSKNSKGSTKRFRMKNRIEEKDFVILFLSRIDYKKGLDLLIPAISRLSKRFNNIKMVLAGSREDSYYKKVKSWIEEYKLSKVIITPGFLSGQEKIDAFQGSDCFILPSLNENFGIAIIEALSYGLPVIISENVYIWKEIVKGGGGWVCKYSTDSIIEVLSHILKAPNELEEKGKNATGTADLFSVETLKPKYETLYRKIATNQIRHY